MIGSPNTLTRLVSHLSSLMHVLLTVFMGYLISASTSTRPMIAPLIFVFVGASKLFTIAFTENKETSHKSRIYLTIALASLLPILIGLTSFEIIVGVLILMLYFLYPLVDGKAPFDVMHHVLRYFFIFTLGYGSQAFQNEIAVLAILAIAFFSVAGELAAGLKKNSRVVKNTASLLGIKGSLIVTASSILIASLVSAFAINGLAEFPIQINQTSIPFYVMPALAIDLFLMMPLMKILTGKCPDPCQLMRRRELVVILMIAISVLVLLQTVRISTEVQVDSRNYSFDVGIRTFIAGANSWDVPWILFDYLNENNYYILVFQKDGILELSQKIDGETIYFESFLKTQLTPFQYHNFHIVLNDTTLVIRLDQEYSMSATRNLEPTPRSRESIMISRPTGFWITFTYTMNVNL